MMHRPWSSIVEVPYCFSRSNVKFQGHTALKIVKFDRNWAFLDSNSSLNSLMVMKCCTKLETAKERCPIVFQSHPSNFKVTRDKTSSLLTRIGRFRTIGRSQLSNPSDLPCFYVPSQWEIMLQCNVSHWLGAYTNDPYSLSVCGVAILNISEKIWICDDENPPKFMCVFITIHPSSHFQDVLDMVKQRLDKTQQSQKILRTIEARDRKTAEMNFERINFWSCVHMVVMITVGLIQVFLVRSLFEDKSMSSKFKVRTWWRDPLCILFE